MQDTNYTTKLFDAHTASEKEFDAVNTFINILRAEELPDDPPRSLEYTVNNLKSLDKFENHELKDWYTWQGERVIAMVFTNIGFHENNRHLINIELGVHPDFRRQGIATTLLRHIVEAADEHGRTLIIHGHLDHLRSGKAFIECLGGKAGLAGHENQLSFADLDRNLIRSWIEDASSTAADFSLGLWDGPFPEEEIDAVIALLQVMNTAPTGELELEDEVMTAQDLRDWEDYMRACGSERWTLYARHTPTGELAGYTETVWNPDDPETLEQGDTAVLPKYRGHGLGKWLKAAMIEKVLAERPQVKRIRTGNADSNAPMLAINHKLGFKPYHPWTDWQIEIEQIRAYLERKNEFDTLL